MPSNTPLEPATNRITIFACAIRFRVRFVAAQRPLRYAAKSDG